LNTLAAEKPKSAEKENYFQLELLRRIYQFLQCGEYLNVKDISSKISAQMLHLPHVDKIQKNCSTAKIVFILGSSERICIAFKIFRLSTLSHQ